MVLMDAIDDLNQGQIVNRYITKQDITKNGSASDKDLEVSLNVHALVPGAEVKIQISSCSPIWLAEILT